MSVSDSGGRVKHISNAGNSKSEKKTSKVINVFELRFHDKKFVAIKTVRIALHREISRDIIEWHFLIVSMTLINLTN